MKIMLTQTKTRKAMKQVGVIVYGRRLNARHWIDCAKQQGFSVLLRDGFCELFR